MYIHLFMRVLMLARNPYRWHSMDRRIKVLDAEVVQRIAAGEVLQRPVNAVKELLENALDAGATRISVVVQVPPAKSGEAANSMYQVTVTDNGHGIGADDLELLCERHATSKLSRVEDLRSVATFGFRGEALASCAQVSRMEVITRSAQTATTGEFGWRVQYLNGKMVSSPQPIAANPGTTIHLRDLFYSNRIRREALQASSEEYQRCVQVVQAYAINGAGRCGFSLSRKRSSEPGSMIDIQTDCCVSVPSVIQSFWGAELGDAVLPFAVGGGGASSEELGILAGSGGWASRSTYHGLSKGPHVIIFLNGRLIDHAPLRRALLQAYAPHLPICPPAHPFIFLSLRMRGDCVDVNVHPTKRQVVFLNELEVVGMVVKCLTREILLRQYESQPFHVRDLGFKRPVAAVETETESLVPACNQPKARPKIAKISTSFPTAAAVAPASQRVLTDSQNTKMSTFLFHRSQSQQCPDQWLPLARATKPSDVANAVEKENLQVAGAETLVESTAIFEEPAGTVAEPEPSINEPSASSTIASGSGVQSDLQVWLESRANSDISSLLKTSLVVGLIDSRWCLLQSGTNLLLGDLERLVAELFFSLLINDEGEGRRMQLASEGGVSIFEAFQGDQENSVAAMELLRSKVSLLELFSLRFDECEGSLSLIEIPELLPGQQCPDPSVTCTFLQRLCLVPEYESAEEAVLKLQIAREIAQYLAVIPAQLGAEGMSDVLGDALGDTPADMPGHSFLGAEHWQNYLQHVILPQLRNPDARFSLHGDFFAGETGVLLADPPVKIITNTETLYKSFERC